MFHNGKFNKNVVILLLLTFQRSAETRYQLYNINNLILHHFTTDKTTRVMTLPSVSGLFISKTFFCQIGEQILNGQLPNRH